MRRHSHKSPPPAAVRPPPATVPSARRPRRLWLVPLIGTLLVFAAWAAWTLLATDPLAEVRAAMDRRDFDAADDLLARRLRDRPTDPAVRLLAARSARRVGDLRAAAAHLDAVYRHVGATDAYEQEARLFRAQTDERVADKLLEEYDSNPDAADAHLLLEAYLEGKLRAVAPMGAGGTTIEAEEAALAAVARSEADLHRAVALWLAARPAVADQAQGHLWRARISFAANKHPQGVEALQKAVEFAPESSDARFQLALAVQLRSPDEARRHLETLLDRQPDNPYFRLGLANTYRMLGRGADARRLYDGLTDGNLRVDALVELGTLDLEDGRLADAERRFRAALDAAPNAAPAVMAMSRLHHLAGRPAEAARLRQRFDELEAARKAAATRPR